jgi:hypothetical protein
MPFYHFHLDDDEDDDDLDEMSDVEPLTPRVAQFHYTPASFRRRPVCFSDQPPPPRGTPERRRSLLDRLLRRGPRISSWERSLRGAERRARRMGDASLAQSYAALRDARKQNEQEWQRRGQQTLALVVPALRGIGVRYAYCRYDGGGDEGFAWLDHVVLGSGDWLTADQAAARLAETGAKPWPEDGDATPTKLGDRDGEAAAAWRDGALTPFADECASRLLGNGFGTGEHLLYGAFTVDLDACTIADDPNADPIVRNIQIEA